MHDGVGPLEFINLQTRPRITQTHMHACLHIGVQSSAMLRHAIQGLCFQPFVHPHPLCCMPAGRGPQPAVQLLESRSLPPRLALVSFRLVMGHIDTYT